MTNSLFTTDNLNNDDPRSTLKIATTFFKASQISNEITINLAGLKSCKISKFSIIYESNNIVKNQAVFATSEYKESELNIPYPPLLAPNEAVAACVFLQDNTSFKFNIPCKAWAIEIENTLPGRLSGWIVVEGSCFVLRPFYLRINQQEVSWTMKIICERPDVTETFKAKGMKGYAINIFHSLSHLDVDSMNLVLEYVDYKHQFMAKILPLDKWKSLAKITNNANILAPKSELHSSKGNPPKIAILMPIYNGINETINALDSFKNYFNDSKINKSNVRFILGLDNPNNHEMKERILELYGSNEQFTVIDNPVNLGFIGNCNNMFEYVENDEEILLVNSDIICPKTLWIEKMYEYAKADEIVATVTPLSNQASIFSFPIPNTKIQALLPHINIEETNNLLLKSSELELVDVPSCHGFCVLIMNTRLSLNQLFDPVFGKGYGEENDLSRRIAKEGFRNICCPEVYIYHSESVSFGPNKNDLVQKNLAKLNIMHEKYDEMIYMYCLNDPLQKYKNIGIFNYLKYIKSKQSKKIILHICHNRGGGTHKFIIDYAQKYADAIHCLLIPIKDSGLISLRLIQPEKSKDTHIQTIELSIMSEDEIINLSSLEILDYTLLHSLIDFPDNGSWKWAKDLLTKSYSFLFIHDYHWISIFENLLNSRFQYTGEHRLCNLVADLNLVKSTKGAIAINKDTVFYQETMQNIINHANELIFPSQAAMDIFTNFYQIENISHVIPHDDSTHNAENNPKFKISHYDQFNRIKIAVIGAIGPNKGIYTLLDICRYIHAHELPIDIYIIGFTCKNTELRNFSFVYIHGAYEENDFPNLIKTYKVQFSLFLSPWPETFSYTLSLAFDNKLWPFVVNLGAPAERVTQSGFGTILRSHMASKICQQILEVTKY
uniref:glycosyltransferase n=1 Tax=Synechococcus sp. UW106 TaxID=368495 RepID=UPI000E0F7821|nr:glycosyltransferase [Synechococcus sp. UW106]